MQDLSEHNVDLILKNQNIYEDLKKRLINKKLTFYDLINNYELFKDITIDNYVQKNSTIDNIATILGKGNFYKVFYSHFDFFKHLFEHQELEFFYKYLSVTAENYKSDKKLNYEMIFINAVKKFLEAFYLFYRNIDENGNSHFYLPDYIASFNFIVVDEYHSWNEMSTYTDHVYVGSNIQRLILEKFGIDNLKQFEKDTGFFTHANGNNFNTFIELYKKYYTHRIINLNNYYKNKNIINYDDFLNDFANNLCEMRRMSSFTKTYNYDFIKGNFRNKFPNLFIDINAPDELKEAFYTNKITIQFLQEHQEYIPYLIDKKLDEIIKGDFDVQFLNTNIGYDAKKNFITFYSNNFGNKELLKLLVKYGNVCDDLGKIKIDIRLSSNNFTKEIIDNQFRLAIYERIITTNINYGNITDEKFKKLFPELFLDLTNVPNISYEDKKIITNSFYKRQLNYFDVKLHPELIDILKGKNLYVIFGIPNLKNLNNDEDYDLFTHITPENFLRLCLIFSNYMECIDIISLKSYKKSKGLSLDIPTNFEDLKKLCEDVIAKKCIFGEYRYEEFDTPEFLKKDYPELFLDDNAPLDLKNEFYKGMSFEILSYYKDEWLAYLKNKSTITTFLKATPQYKDAIISYFNLFGNDKALYFVVKNPRNIMQIISSNKVDLAKQWYDKTGRKFIPNHIIIQNFDIAEADKFLKSISYWQLLMNTKRYSENHNVREALLKLAYSFGVFDQDLAGFKKIKDLLNEVPHTLSIEELNLFTEEALLNNNDDNNYLLKIEYKIFKTSFKEEGLIFNDNEEILNQIYKKSFNGNYVLAIDPQKYPKSMQLLREYMENIPNTHLMNPEKIHRLFSGFKMEYDKEFREFLLANLDKLDENNGSYIGSIQRRFKEIKAINSNRVLTFELALNYVKNNHYENVILGNEKMAEISSIAGYSQQDFETLQQIYHYGRMRTFSSIPRIENKTENYSYEILRLDDPLALAIGTLTDCCQELHNAAEVCMEHSMVDPNGRIFVIRDNEGNIVSQSWVWRNKDVLCFDNIEIPHKAFKRASLNRTNFAKEIYNVYKQAAHELIDEDEKVYKQLLDDGKISEEQYKGLRLGKITVGLGYNDIANAIKNHAIKDNNISRPIEFKPPVDLNRPLYTNDSEIQYILEERKDRAYYNGETPAIHFDSYTIYNNLNFTEKDLILLQKLELNTRNITYNTQISNQNNKGKIVSNIANNYDFRPELTKIVMNSNFAIIYEDNTDEIKIGDIFINSNLNNQIDIIDEVIKQIRLALNQISKNKQINTSILEDYALEVLTKITNTNDKKSFL